MGKYMRQSWFKLSILIGLLGFGFAPPTQGGDLEQIQQRGKLIVGVKNNLPPLGFYDSQGNLQGYEIDIAKRLAEELLGDSDAVILQPVTNQQRLEVVWDEKVDLTIAQVANTSSRARMVSLSEHYYLDSTGFITKNNHIEGLKQLAQAKIVVLKNSSTIPEIRYQFPQAQLIGVDSYEEAKEALDSNQGDVFAGDTSVLVGWQQQHPEYRLLKEHFGAKALSIVLPKGLENTELLRNINMAIARWRKSGWLRERATYWGLP